MGWLNNIGVVLIAYAAFYGRLENDLTLKLFSKNWFIVTILLFIGTILLINDNIK